MLPRSRSFFVVSCLALAALAGCSGSGDSGKAQGSTAAKSAKSAAGKAARLKLGVVQLQSVGARPNLDKAAQTAMLTGAQTYVDSAVYEPLSSGKVGAKFANLFEADLRKSATVTDAAALTDSGVGKVKTYTGTSTPVAVSGLADGTGALLYLSTKFTVNVKATSEAGPLTLARTVEFTWAPTGKGWSVAAYRVLATRKLPKATTTTVAASSGSKP